MASRQVDGVRIPEFVAGHHALELCNTRAGWGTVRPKEYLLDYEVFAVWSRENALISPAECTRLLGLANGRPREARAAITTVRRLRDALYAGFVRSPAPDAPDAEPPAADLKTFIVAAIKASTYRADAEGRLRLDGGSDDALTLQSPIHRAALAAHRLLETHGQGAVGRCPGEGCGWLFFDPSRRRRWCIMAVCGNRAKARRFAERQRT